MNYKLIYENIIKLASARGSGEEKHHIIPRSMGGSNCKNNLVKLTCREHYVCHRLLAKIYPHSEKMALAVLMMNNFNKKYISSKYYENLREMGLKLAKMASLKALSEMTPDMLVLFGKLGGLKSKNERTGVHSLSSDKLSSNATKLNLMKRGKGVPKSSVPGVNWESKEHRWRIRPQINGIKYSLGYSNDLSVAEKICKEFKYGIST